MVVVRAWEESGNREKFSGGKVSVRMNIYRMNMFQRPTILNFLNGSMIVLKEAWIFLISWK